MLMLSRPSPTTRLHPPPRPHSGASAPGGGSNSSGNINSQRVGNSARQFFERKSSSFSRSVTRHVSDDAGSNPIDL